MMIISVLFFSFCRVCCWLCVRLVKVFLLFLFAVVAVVSNFSNLVRRFSVSSVAGGGFQFFSLMYSCGM